MLQVTSQELMPNMRTLLQLMEEMGVRSVIGTEQGYTVFYESDKLENLEVDMGHNNG